ncbi:hypothetical protein [Streptomyces sp. ISL-86]|uniref:hypothetical protein n=1 Tax=Streptomyces sp. ISL-86 TaxID=2819187 RepID=UPI001BE9245A|nr:hypothetical protein [Streptomyces sp. ISL-86]MBT2458081.1 hypothetical protein [Streptomyces sp. ISL-86]
MAMDSTPRTDDQVSRRLTRDRRHLAQELARRVVTETADHETRYFDQRARAYFRPHLPWAGRRTTRFDPVGLPGELVTPVALAVATALLGAASTAVVARLERTFGGWRRRRQREPEAAPTSTTPAVTTDSGVPTASSSTGLSAADLANWRAIALTAALQCNAPEGLARRVADATLAGLVQHLAEGTLPAGHADAGEGTTDNETPPEPPVASAGDGGPASSAAGSGG